MIVLKCYLSLPLVAGALLVGLPYSISLVAQWLYGWPSKPGYQKYLEAVKPRRIYCLTRAVLEMLKYLQYGKLYFQWKLWYSNDKNNKHYVKVSSIFVFLLMKGCGLFSYRTHSELYSTEPQRVKVLRNKATITSKFRTVGLTFGRRGNKLDLYYSPSTGHSDAAPVPVVVFVYGGAWGSGDRSIYCLLALQMAKELNASVICPDYSIYPKGNVLNMIQDISDSLLWVREKGNAFNLDQDNIILIGHSAGAHLCAITTLFLVNNVEELFIETNKQRDLVSAIKGIIGLSGVYSIMDHYKHEKMRAVEYVSTMHKAMDGVENFDYYSPISLLKKLNKDQLKRVPPVGLLHGTNDIIVPVESSVMFSELLTSLSVSMSLYLIPKMNHTEMVTDLMAPDRHFYHTVYGCIKQEYSKFQG